MIEQEKLQGCGEKQADRNSCIPACVSTALRYYGYPDYTQGILKNEIIDDFSAGKEWPAGSTFGNYKTIIERSKIASSFEVKWPLVDDEEVQNSKNETILEKAKNLLSEDSLVLIGVHVGIRLVHCHSVYQISDSHVHYWEPIDNSMKESPIADYLKKMTGDAMSIGVK